LGDVVLTLPILPILRFCFPDAHIAMLLKRYTGEIVEGNPYLNELIWYDEGAGPVPFWKMRRELQARNFDAAVVVYPRFRLAWLMTLAGIPIRIGTGFRFYSFLFNRRVYEHRKNATRHEVDYNIGLLRELGCRREGEPEFFINIPDASRQRIRELTKQAGDRRIVVLHPGSGGSAREWPATRFGALAAMLQKDHVSIFVTGTEVEKEKVEQVVSQSGGNGVSLAGKLNVKELAALLEQADLFVSNSTGPLHIAVAVGTSVVGIYPQHTAMSSARWGPRTGRKRVFVPSRPLDCEKCLEKNAQPCECMSSITVEEVYHGARELLDRGAGVHSASVGRNSE